ncbi:MAG: hypothetical protein MI725_08620 [Pirellulales bacterium]|nr:hypothetical protein [Pirellulales bacterium]
MKGTVDDAGRALLTLAIRPTVWPEIRGQDVWATGTEVCELTVWVDTAFDGELVIPRATIHELSLPQSSAVKAILADGSDVLLETFGCQVEWFGIYREVEVIANEGHLPLLGVGMLRDRKLTVNYPTCELFLE